MSRTTEDAVSAIIEVDSSISLLPFIEVAASLVDEVANESNSTLNEARLELVERWLSAHFYCMRDPRPTSEKAGSVGANYQSKVDLNLATSHYGQMAMVLESDGILAAINRRATRGKKRARVWWGGRKITGDDSETNA